MCEGVDPEDGLAEMAHLWSAESAADLHRVLVLHQLIRRSADAFEPFLLLTKHHETEPESSAVTALLLLTDPRWSKGVSQLVRRIEEAEVLMPAELDLLAEEFVASDGALDWEVPDDWFDPVGFVIDLDVDSGGPPLVEHEDAVEAPVGPAVTRREVFPPLLRWASCRLVRRDPADWVGLLGRARHLRRREGAALVSGLLDAIDTLPAPAQGVLVESAVDWPDQAVRLAAFGRLAEREGPQAAQDPGSRRSKRASPVMGQDDPSSRNARRPRAKAPAKAPAREETTTRPATDQQTSRRCSDTDARVDSRLRQWRTFGDVGYR